MSSRYEPLSDYYRRENAVEMLEDFFHIYEQYAESDGTYVVGELVKVKLPTGDWVVGAIAYLERWDEPMNGGTLHVVISVVRGRKVWRIEVCSPRDIKLLHRMRPFDAWRKH